VKESVNALYDINGVLVGVAGAVVDIGEGEVGQVLISSGVGAPPAWLNSGELPVTPFFSLTSGSQSGIYVEDGANSGRAKFSLVGGNPALDLAAWSGSSWNVTVGGVVAYQSSDDVADPTLCTAWTIAGGVAPLPDTSVLYGPVVQETLQQLAERGAEVLTGNTLWVDAVNGDDATGVSGRQDRPFLTLTAAKTAATVGDLIHVRPGTYAITGNLAKNGVNWYFEQGASVSMVQDGEFGMFDDEDTAMSFSVGGFGEFHMTSASEDFSFVYAITTRNDGTNIKVTGKSILASTSAVMPFGSDSSGAVAGIKGALEVNFDTIESDGFGYCVHWNNGPMHVNARRIVGWGNGAVIASTLPDAMTGKLWVQADEISCAWDGGSTIAISCQAQNPLAQVWIRALEISRTGTGPAVINQGGKLYVEAQKIISDEDESFKSDSVVSDAQSWITAQKITGGSKQILVTAGTTYVDCPHLEEGPSQTVGVDVQGGTLYLNSQTMTAVNGDGVTISGGVCNISGLTIDTSGSATKNPIVKSGGSLTLNDCTLVAEATQDSISAGTAQTVVSSASKCFQEVGANVTVEGDLFYNQGGPTVGQVPTANADGTWSWT